MTEHTKCLVIDRLTDEAVGDFCEKNIADIRAGKLNSRCGLEKDRYIVQTASTRLKQNIKAMINAGIITRAEADTFKEII